MIAWLEVQFQFYVDSLCNKFNTVNSNLHIKNLMINFLELRFNIYHTVNQRAFRFLISQNVADVEALLLDEGEEEEDEDGEPRSWRR